MSGQIMRQYLDILNENQSIDTYTNPTINDDDHSLIEALESLIKRSQTNDPTNFDEHNYRQIFLRSKIMFGILLRDIEKMEQGINPSFFLQQGKLAQEMAPLIGAIRGLFDAWKKSKRTPNDDESWAEKHLSSINQEAEKAYALVQKFL